MPRPLCSRPAPKYVDKKRQENGYKTEPATSSRGYEPPAKRGYEPKYAKRAVTVTTSAKKQTTVDKAIDGVDTFLQNATGQFGGLTSNSPIAMFTTQEYVNKLRIFSQSSSSYIPEWVPDKDDVAGSLKQLGFQPGFSVMCINSMVGSCLVAEKTTVPAWKGKRVVLSIADLIGVVLKNGAGMVSGNEWKSKMVGLLDEDGDGVEYEELKAFVEQDDELKDDAEVLECLKKAAKEGGDALKAMAPVKEKIKAACNRSNEEDGLSNDTVMAQSAWARHMSLVDGWKDPGAEICVRPDKEGYGISAVTALSEVPVIKQAATLMGALLEPLQAFGYEPGKNLRAMTYDWRCAISKLEERDQYFSRLKKEIVDLHRTSGREVVLMAHSMGCRIGHYFLHWITHTMGEAKGKEWLDTHVHSFVPLAGPMAGAESGTEQFLQPGNCSGLAPAVVSFTDGFAMVRSWGSMPLLFGNGSNLKSTAASHYFFARMEGAVHIEMLTAEYAGLGDDEMTKVHIEVKGVDTGSPLAKFLGSGLTGTSVKGSSPVYNDIYQFAWEEEPDSVEGRDITLKLVDDNLVWDTPLGEATFKLSTTSGEDPASVTKFTPDTVIKVSPNEWVSLKNVTVNEKATVTLRVRFVPASCELSPEFQCKGEVPGCGGEADAVATCAEKSAALEAAGLTTWAPAGDNYLPKTTEEMFMLEDIGPDFKMWQQCYAEDPIFRKIADNAAPAIKLCQPIYGINMKTQMGAIFKRTNNCWNQGRRTNFFVYDKEATVAHSGYTCKDGQVFEKPHACPQSTQYDGRDFTTLKCSGDMTVPLWSLRAPAQWCQDDMNVNIIEIEGGTHRGVLGMPACHYAVLSHIFDTPTLTLRVKSVSVSAGALGDNGEAASAVFVQFILGDKRKSTAAIAIAKANGEDDPFGAEAKAGTVDYDPEVGYACEMALMQASGVGGLGKGTPFPGAETAKVPLAELLSAGVKQEPVEVSFGEGLSLKLEVAGFKEKKGWCQCW